MSVIKPPGAIKRTLNKEQITALAEADAQPVIADDKYDLLKLFMEMKHYEHYFKIVMDSCVTKIASRFSHFIPI